MNFFASTVSFLVAVSAVFGSAIATWQDYANRAVEPRWYFISLKDTALKVALFVGGLCVFDTWLRVVF